MTGECCIWVECERNKQTKARICSKDQLSFWKQCCCVCKLTGKPSEHQFVQTNKYSILYIMLISKLSDTITMKWPSKVIKNMLATLCRHLQFWKCQYYYQNIFVANSLRLLFMCHSWRCKFIILFDIHCKTVNVFDTIFVGRLGKFKIVLYKLNICWICFEFVIIARKSKWQLENYHHMYMIIEHWSLELCNLLCLD